MCTLRVQSLSKSSTCIVCDSWGSRWPSQSTCRPPPANCARSWRRRRAARTRPPCRSSSADNTPSGSPHIRSSYSYSYKLLCELKQWAFTWSSYEYVDATSWALRSFILVSRAQVRASRERRAPDTRAAARPERRDKCHRAPCAGLAVPHRRRRALRARRPVARARGRRGPRARPGVLSILHQPGHTFSIQHKLRPTLNNSSKKYSLKELCFPFRLAESCQSLIAKHFEIYWYIIRVLHLLL